MEYEENLNTRKFSHTRKWKAVDYGI